MAKEFVLLILCILYLDAYIKEILNDIYTVGAIFVSGEL